MQQLADFAEANHYLTRFYENSPVKYDLKSMRQLMDYLGNSQDKLRVVHVAGTSGKTSTAYYMAALLTAAGRRVGLTVSPHVDEINERVQLDGRPLSEAAFCEALTSFLELVEAGPLRPSWFEVVAGFAYWYFAREQVEYAVVEVGLGGLQDGTNVINRADKVCLLTDIGLDHVKVLGDTLAEIAQQKVGIVQPGNVAFSYRQEPAIMAVFADWCADKQATLHVIDQAEAAHDYGHDLASLPAYQQRNWLLAYQAYSYLQNRDNLQHVTSQALRQSESIQVPGRMDIRHWRGKILVMDGAHNEQKMIALLHSFRQLYPGVKPAILISLKDGKDYDAVVPLLAPLAGSVIITSFIVTQDTPVHSVESAVLQRAFAAAGVSAVVLDDQHEAFQALLQAPESVCLITGSFYLLGQIRNNELTDD